MTKEFKKIKSNTETRYVIESASGGGTSAGAVASAPGAIPSIRRRDNILVQDTETVTVPVKQKPRQGPLRQQTGAGAHRDKKKEQKAGKEKHKKAYFETEVTEAQVPTMRKYYAGDTTAQDQTKLAQMRDYFAQLDQRLAQQADKKPDWFAYGKPTTPIKNPRVRKIEVEDELSELKEPSGAMFLKFRVKTLPNEEKMIYGYGGFGTTPKDVTVSNAKIKPFQADDSADVIAKIRSILGDEEFIGVEKIMLDIPSGLMKPLGKVLDYAERDEKVDLYTSTGLEDEPDSKSGGKVIGIDPEGKRINREPAKAQVGGSSRGVASTGMVTVQSSQDGQQLIQALMSQGRLSRDTKVQGSNITLRQNDYKKILDVLGNDRFQAMFRKVGSVAEAKPGWMLKQDPKLGAKVKAKTDLAKKRQAAYGDPSAGKSVEKNKEQGLAEGNPEYDDEAGMADNNLETLRRTIDGLDNLIKPGDNLPEWCQEKIAVAKSMLVAVWDYMLSEKDRGAVAEGDPGAKYRIKQTGHDAKGDYYISPSTGKKVYKQVNKGDHENPDTGEIKPKVKEAFQNDEANMMYRYDLSSGRLKQAMISNHQEQSARSQGYKDTPEQALRDYSIIRSKFNPNKFVQNQGNKWVEVFPFGKPGENEDISRRGFLQGLGAAAGLAATGMAKAGDDYSTVTPGITRPAPKTIEYKGKTYTFAGRGVDAPEKGEVITVTQADVGIRSGKSIQVKLGDDGKFYIHYGSTQESSDAYMSRLNSYLESQLDEKIPPNADVDYYIQDFAKSNAPQFRGKTKEKRRQMAIAAYYGNKQKKKK